MSWRVDDKDMTQEGAPCLGDDAKVITDPAEIAEHDVQVDTLARNRARAILVTDKACMAYYDDLRQLKQQHVPLKDAAELALASSELACFVGTDAKMQIKQLPKRPLPTLQRLVKLVALSFACLRNGITNRV
jgi:hypothetical protein